MGKKVLVAMSGGVDSSVSAYLLKRSGWTVGGATIRTWASGECENLNTKACCGISGVEDAQEVARKLNIPHYVFNFEREFKKSVVDYFSKEYLEGRTPNPCVACNQYVKFKLFFRKARELGYDYIATGHYGRISRDPASKRYFIEESEDPLKDQSYVLFPLDQDVLSRLELPVGRYTKEEIREIAREIGLALSDKPDSQEICFIPNNDYGAFLEREAKPPHGRGLVQDLYGNVLGSHKGCHHFTIGQRKGLKIPFKHALYVVDIDVRENIVIAGMKEHVLGQFCEVERIHWLLPLDGAEKKRVQAKIRSRHPKAWATFERISKTACRLCFDEPQEAITPGQACVFYEGNRVLGGGWISKRENIRDVLGIESKIGSDAALLV